MAKKSHLDCNCNQEETYRKFLNDCFYNTDSLGYVSMMCNERLFSLAGQKILRKTISKMDHNSELQ